MADANDGIETALSALLDLLHEVAAFDKGPRAPRYRLRVPVRYRWPDRGAWFTGVTENLSQSGILFAPDRHDPHIEEQEAVRRGTRLSVTLLLPADWGGRPPRQLQADVSVVRTSGGGPGQAPVVGVAVERWRALA